jgi:uncharacterized protein (TIGR00725 family)
MNNMKLRIGVLGSASGPTIRDPQSNEKAYLLGQTIAKNNCMCITGACPGLPGKAAEGAKKVGGFVFGVSPAFSEQEHIEVYGSPMQPYDMILFSGMGLMERDIVNIRSADGLVIVGGGMGTLNEFTVAYEEQKPIGILTGTGGISDHIPEILSFTNRHAAADRILYDSDPGKLISRLLEAIEQTQPPMRESDIGGEKEVLKAQRKQRNISKKETADKEYE